MYGGNPFAYLVDTLFHLLTLALLLRFLLQLVRADFYNPISQAVVAITDPVLSPLRRLLRGRGRVDYASLVAMFVVKGIGLWLTAMVAGMNLPGGALAVLAVQRLLDLTLLFFLITIFVQVILSWIGPGRVNPATALLYQLNAPLLGPARRLLPPMGGLDLSPLFVLVAIQFLRLFLHWVV